MTPIMLTIIVVVVIATLMAIQGVLSKLENPLWGSVIPIIVLGAGLYTYFYTEISLKWSSVLIFAVPLVWSLEEWISGRGKRKQRLQLEIEQMKAKDID